MGQDKEQKQIDGQYCDNMLELSLEFNLLVTFLFPIFHLSLVASLVLVTHVFVRNCIQELKYVYVAKRFGTS